MKISTITINDIAYDYVSVNTVIVGTGAAGFNAADSLFDLGQKDICIVTEGIKMGTSRNTGSDKQTYYKLTLAGDGSDSVHEMAKTLFNGGSMHGDIALTEAALSAKGFYKLASIGVPFPHNKYGEYVGYKTDHDPRQRATSAGPLTSKFMTEKLEIQVQNKKIMIFDGFYVIGILQDKGSAYGLVAINANKVNEENFGITVFNCTNIIYATGGPAGIYDTSVYPISHTGSTGIAFEAGANGINLTESQYGIASIKFRWNLSGTYQQVIPRYISTDLDGNDEKEFLDDYFIDKGRLFDCIFLKGYQWPFDPRKIENLGSSIIDVLVFNETAIKGRRVFMDFRKNPKDFDFSVLSDESYTYLKNSNAFQKTPIERLAHMNKPAIDLYMNNGIDLYNENLEIAVCAQHNNGGLEANIWYESNLRHLFPVGEVNGTFGVYRPGGSALNSTQVASFRAAQYISQNYDIAPVSEEVFSKLCNDHVSSYLNTAKTLIKDKKNTNVLQLRKHYQKLMTKSGAHIRGLHEVTEAVNTSLNEIKSFVNDTSVNDRAYLIDAFRNRDILITRYVYLSAIKEYIEKGGRSRGSYLVRDDEGILPITGLPEIFRFKLDDQKLMSKTCTVKYDKETMKVSFNWQDVRPIPKEDNWFENVWSEYRKKNIIK
ncbi:MAG TPA: FAD-binding protein [Clostridia bacterium]|nr:MAG: succinate dehydrogenase flavoprotein subunit [Firmicutes bacterium ADurb.Bin146]HOD92872.1 FAD-binding protein [Clostridia bacterium]HQM39022.1 FAD-binding protein [Clostridia bacterium]